MLWLEAVMALIMLVGLVGLLLQRFKSNSGIGVRAIQFLGVVIVVPAIVILAVAQILSSEVVGALLGAVVGYVLSGFGAEETLKKSKGSGTKE